VRVAVVDPHRASRSARLVDALRSRVEVVGGVVPSVSRSFDLWNKATRVHRDRDTWRARAFFNGARFRALSENAAIRLSELPSHDVVLHVYPVLCAPPGRVPYVVLTDNTMAVTQRSFRRWANLSRRETAASVLRERDLFRGAAFVATFGSQARASAIDDYGCDPDRVVTVGVATNLPAETPDRPEGKEVLFVATSFWRKGGATLLEAWATVVAQVPDAQLTIVGPRHAPPTGMPGTVRWLGPKTSAELRSLYSDANVFVLPTLFEASLPNVIREAMAHGLPVVASDIAAIATDGPPEILLFPPDDADALAARLLMLLRDPAEARARGLRLREASLRDFTWERLAERVAALLERAADEVPRGGG
jgi:glycosyltransferase involved in cell wall biosynthesis